MICAPPGVSDTPCRPCSPWPRPSPAGFCGRLKPGDTPHLAIDGKTLRGSRDGETPAVHLLSAYAPNVEAIVAQMRAAYG